MRPRLDGKKVAVLIESDFYEPEIHYYQRRFPEEGAEIHFLTNLWGQPSLTFTGHEFKEPFGKLHSVGVLRISCRRQQDACRDKMIGPKSRIAVPSARNSGFEATSNSAADCAVSSARID